MDLISNFVTNVDEKFASVAQNFSSELTNKLLPLIALFFSLYILFKAIKLMRGENDFLITDLLFLLLKMGVILSIGLAAEGYVQNVIPIVRNFGNDLSTLTGYTWGKSSEIDALLNIYVQGASSSFSIINIVEQSQSQSNMFLWLTMMILLVFGVLPLFSLIAFLFIFQSIALNVLLYFGPLFIGLLLFESTRGYFDRWMSSIFQFTLLQVILLMMVNISMDITKNNVSLYPSLSFQFMISNAVVSWSFILLAYALIRLIYQITNSKFHSVDRAGSVANYTNSTDYIYSKVNKRKPG